MTLSHTDAAHLLGGLCVLLVLVVKLLGLPKGRAPDDDQGATPRGLEEADK